jgi:hypothetical protein
MVRHVVNDKKITLRFFARILGVEDKEIAQKLDPPVTPMQISRVMTLSDGSPRVRTEIIETLGLPKDFFTEDYRMTITLEKVEKETQAA